MYFVQGWLTPPFSSSLLICPCVPMILSASKICYFTAVFYITIIYRMTQLVTIPNPTWLNLIPVTFHSRSRACCSNRWYKLKSTASSSPLLKVRKTVYGAHHRAANDPERDPHNFGGCPVGGGTNGRLRTCIGTDAVMRLHTHADFATGRITRHRLAVQATRAPCTTSTMVAGALVVAISCWSLFAAAAAKHGSNGRSVQYDEDHVRRYRTTTSTNSGEHCCTGQSSLTAALIDAESANTEEVNNRVRLF